MVLDSLVIEVTRRCNMACEHCLRGCAQNVDMPFETIDKIFEGIDIVYNITFTGGEPFLNIDAIEYTLKYVKEHNIKIFSVFVVTNGKHFEERYISVMNDWIVYCMENNIDMKNMLENGDRIMDMEEIYNYSGIAVSRDEYHESIPIKNYLRYRMLSYYSTSKERESYGNRGLILEGKAYENGFYGTVHIPSRFDFEDWEDDDWENGTSLVSNLVYVSCLGEVVADCDLSYEHIEDESIGNINDTCLLDLFKKYAEEEQVA